MKIAVVSADLVVHLVLWMQEVSTIRYEARLSDQGVRNILGRCANQLGRTSFTILLGLTFEWHVFSWFTSGLELVDELARSIGVSDLDHLGQHNT